MGHSMKSIAIRASAGTGKTYELTVQYIARLAHARDPSKLLATTFTRKAAGEILGRIIERLARAVCNAEEGAVLEREIAVALGVPPGGAPVGAWNDLLTLCCRNLHRVNVSTLDALFVRLLAAFLPDLGYASMPTMADEKSAEAVEARMSALEEALSALESASAVNLLRDLYGGRAVRSVINRTEAAMGQLYDLAWATPPTAWGNMTTPTQVAPPAVLSDAIARILAAADVEKSSSLAKGLRTSAQDARDHDWMRVLTRGASKKVAEVVLSADGADQPIVYNRQTISAELADLLTILVTTAAHHICADLTARTRALRDLLDRFAQSYADELRRAERLPFTELARVLAASDRWCSPLEIAYRLGLKVDHVLLDEFQDTNRAQWQVLRDLFLVPGDGEVPAESPSGRRASIFCVGDTKQAIYGWRGGCAGIFDALDEEIPELAWDHREKSFRSSQVVLDTVNRVFTRLHACPPLADYPNALAIWSKQYRAHEAAADKPGYVALIQAPRRADSDHSDEDDTEDLEDPCDSDFEPRETAATRRSAYHTWVAQHIQQLAADHSARTIGILVRTNAAADSLAYALHTLGVRASIEGPGNLADDPAVQLILSAMLLADHPGSTAEAFHILRSPLRRVLGLRDMTPAERARVSHSLRLSLAERGWTPVIAELAHALSPYGGPRTVRRLTHLLQATAEYESRGGSRPADYVRWVRSQTVHDPADAAVRIMTIHQAKGLQFDIVVAPDISSKIHAVAPLVVEERKRETDPPHAVFAYPNAVARLASPDAQRAYDQHRDRQVAEALNVLYVLLTRAVHALYLMVPPLRIRKDGQPRKLDLSYEAILRHTLAQDVHSGAFTLYQHGNADWDQAAESAKPRERVSGAALTTVHRVVFGRTDRRRHWPEASPSELHRTVTPSVRELLRLDTQAANQGSLLHAWFQAIEWLDCGLPNDEQLIRIAAEAVPYSDPVWVRTRVPLFRAALEREAVRSVFARPAGLRDLWRERSFMIRLDDIVVQGRIDRLVITAADGLSATITDFKTDSVDAEAVPERARLYEEQMRTYVLAVSQMLNMPLAAIRAQLLFIVPGLTHEIQIER